MARIMRTMVATAIIIITTMGITRSMVATMA
jgi:hypothetical protein